MLTIDLGSFWIVFGACWYQHPRAVRALPGMQNFNDIFFLNHEIPTRRSLLVHTAYWRSFFCDSWMGFHASGFLYSLLCTIAVCCLGVFFCQIGSCKLIHPSKAIASSMLCRWNLKSPCVPPILHKSKGNPGKIQCFHHCFPEAMTAMMQLPLCGGKAESRSGEVWKDQTLWRFHWIHLLFQRCRAAGFYNQEFAVVLQSKNHDWDLEHVCDKDVWKL